MHEYTHSPRHIYHVNNISVSSFIGEDESNLDKDTVSSFGEEWKKFNNFHADDIATIGCDYFDLLDLSQLSNAVVLDVGCGSGRWAKFLSPHVKLIEAIDPSDAVNYAVETLKELPNVRVTRASVNHIPFPDNSFDLVYSLGVLHHVPDTGGAISRCYDKIKNGGFFLVYLYYSPRNRGLLFWLLFKASDFLRQALCRLPGKPKRLICDIIAVIVYWPFAKICLLVSAISPNIAAKIPLYYYRKTSFHIMRNDSLDRFGTPLEKRFSREEIELMLKKAGFINIKFSDQEPYWHVLGQKLHSV